MSAVVKQIYKLRRDFILVGLTGRTGSGCTTVANLLCKKDFSELKSKHKDINDTTWDNDSRKSRIVYKYMQQHWHAFTCIKASDVIFFYALLLEFNDFLKEISTHGASDNIDKLTEPKKDAEIETAVNKFSEQFEVLHKVATECNNYIEDEDTPKDIAKVNEYIRLITEDIPAFRRKINEAIKKESRATISDVLQRWGNNIRSYDTIETKDIAEESDKAPACLARKINRFIKIIRWRDRKDEAKNKAAGKEERPCTHIVIDALRNPYEVLYFRERYSAFYLMSINTDEKVRRAKLVERGFDIDEITSLDKEEADKKKNFKGSYQKIDINKCIELSDIYITHNGEDVNYNRNLVDQILTYLSLMRHPGLVPPSPLERVMQIAYTAKLNSGCLSRQVGAVVTNKDFSVKSVGWNTVPQGQTPCNLRSLYDLYRHEDDKAFSNYERTDLDFQDGINRLYGTYCDCGCEQGVIGLPLSYCFKDIHNTISGQFKNQVHTRSLHAEENAILQLSKYGSSGIEGGKLFTTSSCCELCGKKAYQLGITEIFYIDDYPGITRSHIIACGTNAPKMTLFHGAIGRAYISLYNQFLPLKDEIEALTGINVKDKCRIISNEEKETTTES